MAYPPIQQNTGLYVPNTFMLDVQELYSVDVTSPQFKELLVRLYQNLNVICESLNKKESGLYKTQEFVSGNLFFNPLSSNQNDLRSEFITVVDFGALPNSATTTVAHNIPDVSDQWWWTMVYATATDPVTQTGITLTYPIVQVDSTNVTITTTSDLSAFTRCIVVLRYLKN